MNLFQTFYIDPNSVTNAPQVYVTSVDLYFKILSPAPIPTMTDPGVVVSIYPTTGTGYPDLVQGYLPESITRIAKSSITATTDASVATKFTFNQPILIDTNTQYAISVKSEDPNFPYDLWTAKMGDNILGSSTSFGGFTNGTQGNLYDFANDGTVLPRTNTKLKFTTRIAKFSANNASYELVNKNFEFFVSRNINGTFLGGERAYKEQSNVSAQTVSIAAGSNVVVGTGTTFTSYFTVGSYFVAYSNSTTDVVRQVASIANNTQLTVSEPFPVTNTTCSFFKTVIGKVYSSSVPGSYLYLTDSTANSSLNFAKTANVTGTVATTAACTTVTGTSTSFTTDFRAGDYVLVSNSTYYEMKEIATIANGTSLNTTLPFNFAFTGANARDLAKVVGEQSGAKAGIYDLSNLPVTHIKPEIGVNTSSGGNVSVQYDFSYYNGTKYVVDSGNIYSVDNNSDRYITEYNATIMSRSNELDSVNYSPNDLYGTSHKSAFFRVNLNQSGTVSAGIYDAPSIYSEKIDIFSGKNQINNDSTNENDPHYGKALAKHITTRLNFAADKSAEDVRVYTTAYRPEGTDILAYVKLYNHNDNDAFDDKDWTPLITVNNTGNQYSTSSKDYKEFEFGLSPSLSSTTLTGTIAASSSSDLIEGASTTFNSDLVAGDVVKIYSDSIAADFQIASVISVNSDTEIQLDTIISNSSIYGVVNKVAKVTTPHSAFLNNQNGNVSRYYNSTTSKFDSFDVMQVKIVLLSNNNSVSPRLSDLRAIGVSA